MPADHGHPVFDHEGPWTTTEVLTLPEDRRQRVELVDGALLVSPIGTVRHQRLVLRAVLALNAACPPGLEALPGANLALSDSRMLIPDFTVNETGDDGLALPSGKLVLAGEVLSPSTRLVDLAVKRRLYAEAGVPFYLVVDPQESEVGAVLYELGAGGYVEAVRSVAGVLKLDRPFPVVIELSS